MVFSSWFCGSIFYMYENEWKASTAMYYSLNTMLGVLYYVPANKTPLGDGFTLMFYIFGTFGLATLAGLYVGYLVANAPETRKQMLPPEVDLHVVEHEQGYENEITTRSWMEQLILWRDLCLIYIQWEDNFGMYVTFLLAVGWVMVGGIYWYLWEGWTFASGVFFSISTLSLAAYESPPCDPDDDPEDCEIGLTREMFLSLYVIVGVPLFTISLGQVTAFVVKRAVRNHESAILNCPLTEEEYNYAANLYDNDEVISLGEFTMLELLRLGRVTMEDLNDIKDLFNSIDEGQTGNIDKEALAKKRLMSGYRYGSFDETLLMSGGVAGDLIVPDEVEDTTLHMLTENDRANSLPAEITEEMYECIDVEFFEEEGLEMDFVAELPQSHHPQSHHKHDRRDCSIVDDKDHSDFGSTTSSFQRLGMRRLSFNEYNEIVVPLSVSIAQGTDDHHACDRSQLSSKC
jgi:hypothetical protein